MYEEREERGVQGLSRRGFIAAAAACVAGIATVSMSGCAPQDTSASRTGSSSSVSTAVPDEWDGTYDVIVCGGGGSGLTAAYSALENGATSVLVLEKAAACGGTTATAEGAIQAPGTRWQKELTQYKDDTPDRIFGYWMTDAEGLVEEDLVRIMADNAADNLEWMAENFNITFGRIEGVPPVPYLPREFMADRMHIITDASDTTLTGDKVWTTNALAAVQAKGGEIMTDTAAASLIVDGANGVVGVTAADGRNYRATHGVCLCMAGIDHNEELAKRYNPQHYWELKNGTQASAATDTGDGIIMGLAAGADIGRVGGTVSLVDKTFNGSHLSDPDMPAIYVNTRGCRFVREDTQYAYQMRSCYNEAMKQGGWDGCTWEVMDAKMTRMDRQSAWSDNMKGGADQRAKDIASGELLQADSIEALATAMGVDAANLAATVAKWNADVAAGVDTQLGRERQLTSLDEAPFYAYRMKHYNVGSIGALRIDGNAQIIDRSGDPIPHLFGGGQNTSGWIGPYYPGSGTSLQGTLNWGRIAGRNAALA